MRAVKLEVQVKVDDTEHGSAGIRLAREHILKQLTEPLCKLLENVAGLDGVEHLRKNPSVVTYHPDIEIMTVAAYFVVDTKRGETDGA